MTLPRGLDGKAETFLLRQPIFSDPADLKGRWGGSEPPPENRVKAYMRLIICAQVMKTGIFDNEGGTPLLLLFPGIAHGAGDVDVLISLRHHA